MSRKPNNQMGPSQRQLRVGEQLRHTIVEILQRGHFDHPLLLDHASDVTVLEVRPSPDLKHAHVFVMALGSNDLDDLIEALNQSTNYIQKEINNKLRLKFTPKIRFRKDTSFDQGGRIDEILRNIPKPKDED